MAFKKNIRNFGQRQGKVGTKFVSGVNKISNRSKVKTFR
jgi:hypothetical protein